VEGFDAKGIADKKAKSVKAVHHAGYKNDSEKTKTTIAAKKTKTFLSNICCVFIWHYH
jgi:hypothetical protein